MLIGVPKEVKNNEFRVGLIPANVRELIHHGHQVIVEKDAGIGIGFSDDDYQKAGAKIISNSDDIFAQAEMIVKVKEPQPFECKKLRPGQLLFTYLHLAPDPEQTKLLLESGCTAIAYETVTDGYGTLPLLAPMSEVAGRLSIQAGAFCLEKSNGGRGVLLGGVPGVKAGKVVIIGGGVSGTHAAMMASGLGADVTIFEKSLKRIRELDTIFDGRVKALYSTKDALEEHVIHADLVVGAVLIPGAAAPKLITRELLKKMPNGSVFVDIAIDQGGCAETSRATTHADPIYTEEGVIHYCVSNMPGAVARTSTFALNNATLPFAIELADKGYKKAIADNIHLRNGLNVHAGKLTYKAVADSLKLPYTSPEEALSL